MPGRWLERARGRLGSLGDAGGRQGRWVLLDQGVVSGVNFLTGIVLAHSVMAMPLVVILVASSFKGYDMNQEMVARSLGASRPWAFLTVTLPQIRTSVMSAALLAFITSLDEVVISLFIAGGDTATLTRRMFNALRDEIDPTIAAISTLLILISVVLLGLTQLLQRPARPSGKT